MVGQWRPLTKISAPVVAKLGFCDKIRNVVNKREAVLWHRGSGMKDHIMTTYIITEKQNLNSSRRGETIEAKDLTAAKRAASRMKMFKDTVMTIESESGMLLCWKDRSGKWNDE